MQTVLADGTQIALRRRPEGLRKFKKLGRALRHCTVINYDRRGRGDSGNAGLVSVQHEVDDLAALIDAVGGRASLWGYSSGGAVALAGRRRGRRRREARRVRDAVQDRPRRQTFLDKYPADDYGARLDQILAGGDRTAAAKHFMRNGVGIPGPLVAVMSLLPMFKGFAINGQTLSFDYAALGDHNMRGAPLRAEEWATVTCPTLVAYGAKTVDGLKHASRALAEALPNATLRELPGQNHNVSQSAIVPLLAEFVAGSAAVAV